MEVRKGTIKKPKFIPTYVVSVVIMLVVLFVLRLRSCEDKYY